MLATLTCRASAGSTRKRPPWYTGTVLERVSMLLYNCFQFVLMCIATCFALVSTSWQITGAVFGSLFILGTLSWLLLFFILVKALWVPVLGAMVGVLVPFVQAYISYSTLVANIGLKVLTLLLRMWDIMLPPLTFFLQLILHLFVTALTHLADALGDIDLAAFAYDVTEAMTYLVDIALNALVALISVLPAALIILAKIIGALIILLLQLIDVLYTIVKFLTGDLSTIMPSILHAVQRLVRVFREYLAVSGAAVGGISALSQSLRVATTAAGRAMPPPFVKVNLQSLHEQHTRSLDESQRIDSASNAFFTSLAQEARQEHYSAALDRLVRVQYRVMNQPTYRMRYPLADTAASGATHFRTRNSEVHDSGDGDDDDDSLAHSFLTYSSPLFGLYDHWYASRGENASHTYQPEHLATHQRHQQQQQRRQQRSDDASNTAENPEDDLSQEEIDALEHGERAQQLLHTRNARINAAVDAGKAALAQTIRTTPHSVPQVLRMFDDTGHTIARSFGFERWQHALAHYNTEYGHPYALLTRHAPDFRQHPLAALSMNLGRTMSSEHQSWHEWLDNPRPIEGMFDAPELNARMTRHLRDHGSLRVNLPRDFQITLVSRANCFTSNPEHPLCSPKWLHDLEIPTRQVDFVVDLNDRDACSDYIKPGPFFDYAHFANPYVWVHNTAIGVRDNVHYAAQLYFAFNFPEIESPVVSTIAGTLGLYRLRGKPLSTQPLICSRVIFLADPLSIIVASTFSFVAAVPWILGAFAVFQIWQRYFSGVYSRSKARMKREDMLNDSLEQRPVDDIAEYLFMQQLQQQQQQGAGAKKSARGGGTVSSTSGKQRFFSRMASAATRKITGRSDDIAGGDFNVTVAASKRFTRRWDDVPSIVPIIQAHISTNINGALDDDDDELTLDHIDLCAAIDYVKAARERLRAWSYTAHEHFGDNAALVDDATAVHDYTGALFEYVPSLTYHDTVLHQLDLLHNAYVDNGTRDAATRRIIPLPYSDEHTHEALFGSSHTNTFHLV